MTLACRCTASGHQKEGPRVRLDDPDAPDELLVRVDYTSINRMDPLMAKRNIFRLPDPYVLGFDYSGVVVKLGREDPEGLQVGDLVLGSTHGLGGCYAEYVVVKNRPEDRRWILVIWALSFLGPSNTATRETIWQPCTCSCR